MGTAGRDTSAAYDGKDNTSEPNTSTYKELFY
jgi:hypothetical protein